MIRATYRIENASAGEDRVLVERIRDRKVAIVCDGAGNGGRGGLAADLAIAELARLAREGFVDWARAFASIDQMLVAQAEGGETTCVAMEISDAGECRGASVGDSGAWMIPAGRPPVELTEQQGRLRLGSGQAYAVRFKAQLMGQLLLGTDGLFKYIRHRDMPSLARRGVDALVESVRMNGGGFQDDVAVVLIE